MRIPGYFAVPGCSIAGSSPEFPCLSDGGRASTTQGKLWVVSSSILIRCFLRQNVSFFLDFFFFLLFCLEVTLLEPRGFTFSLQNLLTAKLEGCVPTVSHSQITSQKREITNLPAMFCTPQLETFQVGCPAPCLPEKAAVSCCFLFPEALSIAKTFSMNEFNGETKPGNKWPSKTVHFQSSDLAFCLWAVLTYSCQESKESVRL